MVHELEVWLFVYRVGTLALVDGPLYFRKMIVEKSR